MGRVCIWFLIDFWFVLRMYRYYLLIWIVRINHVINWANERLEVKREKKMEVDSWFMGRMVELKGEEKEGYWLVHTYSQQIVRFSLFFFVKGLSLTLSCLLSSFICLALYGAPWVINCLQFHSVFWPTLQVLALYFSIDVMNEYDQ